MSYILERPPPHQKRKKEKEKQCLLGETTFLPRGFCGMLECHTILLHIAHGQAYLGHQPIE